MTVCILALERERMITGPVVVGGVGGSGTRVIAQILTELNIYTGSDLNSAGDNLWFTFLLSRANCLKLRPDSAILKDIKIFHKAMLGTFQPLPNEYMLLGQKILNITYEKDNKFKWSLKRYRNLISSQVPDISIYQGWGWKEPNSHIYLEYLHRHFGNKLKYIHCIRHGLDMAFSKNNNQFRKWGWLFELDNLELKNGSQAQSLLKYWIKANKKAIENGEKFLGSQFKVVNFDKLCSDPEDEVTGLLNFLGIDFNDAQFKKITNIPSVPTSKNRYKNYDISIFSKSDLEEIRKLGFNIDP